MPQAILAQWFIPADVPPLGFLILGSLSVLIMAAGKAGFGGGLGLLSVPLMTYACGSRGRLAIGTMLPLLIACDYVTLLLWSRRRPWDLHNIRLMLGGMLLGIAAGWGTLWAFDQFAAGGGGKASADAAVTLAIGLIALGFVGIQVVRFWRGQPKPFRPTLALGTAAGSAAGFTSTLSHGAGPITTMYLLGQQMPKDRFVATSVMYYWIANQVKLAPYFERGMLTKEALLAGAGLAPAIMVGALLGFFLHGRVNEKVFRMVVHVLLAGAGLDLSIRSAIKLLG